MIIYNVTIKVDPDIAGNWLAWLTEEHIPDVISTGCFTHAGIFRLLEADDTDGPTYIIQYYAESDAQYQLYIEKFADTMRKKGKINGAINSLHSEPLWRLCIECAKDLLLLNKQTN